VATVRGEGTYPWPDGLAERFAGNTDFLFGCEWPEWGEWLPDFEALARLPFPIVLGAGSEDRGLHYTRPSIEIAARLKVPWVEFPGIHLEFLRNPARFGAALRAVASYLHTLEAPIPDLWKVDPGSEGTVALTEMTRGLASASLGCLQRPPPACAVRRREAPTGSALAVLATEGSRRPPGRVG
jgi:hypothetical protein